MTDTALREFLDYPWFEPETDLFVVPADGGPGLAGARDVRVWARGDEPVPILESWGVRDERLRGRCRRARCSGRCWTGPARS